MRDRDAEARQQLLSTMTPAAIRRYLERGYRYHVGEIDGRLVGRLDRDTIDEIAAEAGR